MWEKIGELKILVGVNIYGEHIFLKILEGDEDEKYLNYGFVGCFLDDNSVINIPDYNEGTVYEARVEFWSDVLYESDEVELWLDALYKSDENDFEYRIVETKIKVLD
jgi:hypothetical protein